MSWAPLTGDGDGIISERAINGMLVLVFLEGQGQILVYRAFSRKPKGFSWPKTEPELSVSDSQSTGAQKE